MSLFGESPPPPSRDPERSRSSLFADDDFGSGSGSLFDDSPAWGAPSSFPPAGGASQRNLARSLLTEENARIPDAYDRVYNNLQQAGSRGAESVERVLDEAEVPHGNTRQRIRSSVLGGESEAETVSREQIYLLLAMVGLIKEGEDVSFDAVDERRGSLPVPVLKSLDEGPTAGSEEDPREEQSLPPLQRHARSTADLPRDTPDKPQIVHRQHTSPISTTPVRTRTALFTQEEDPWGSPANNRAMGGGDGAGSSISDRPGPSRRESVRQAPREQEEDNEEEIHEPDDIHAGLRESRMASTSWGTYDGSGSQYRADSGYSHVSSGFGDAPHPGLGARHGSFGGLGGSVLNGTNGTGLDRVRAALKAPEEVVSVTCLPEKEGMFMFQHRNYQIASVRRGSRVVRRYSDFVWLLDCLQKRYPFRQLPLLPPKRLAVNGHYLSADTAFLERRRRGLARFTNALVRHPVLCNEQLVIMFLTVPTELSVWRKQANLSVMEEFTNKPLPPDLEASLPADLDQTFDTVRAGLRKSSEIYIQLCNLVERLQKRHEGIAADYSRVSTALRSLTDASEATYAIDTNDIPLLNDGLNAVANHYGQSKALLEDEAKAWDEGVLEDLKRQRDVLVSMRELFERMDRFAGNNIPQLERRIQANERKIETLRTRPQGAVKPGEMDRVIDAVTRDQESIKRQQERGVLIRECVRDELVFFWGSQYHISRLHQDWSQERVKYAELLADNWRALSSEVEAMPLGE